MRFFIDNFKLLSILQFVSPPKFDSGNRPNHALLFRHSGVVDYDFGSWQTRQEPGEVLLIPKGSLYTSRPVGQTKSKYTVINFQGDFSITEPQKLSLGAEKEQILSLLDRCAAMDSDLDRYWIHSDFYRIVALLEQQANSDCHSPVSLSRIAPALEILRKDLFNPELKVDLLHTACGISHTYFRTLFIARFGLSPKKYIMNQRLIHAKQLLDSGECRDVSETARLSGFEDPMYFSRVFKARYGYPPSKGIVK